MRVLITGGNGFLAGHLAVYLHTLGGIEVSKLSRSDCDLSSEQKKLTSLLRSLRPDRIFHLAGRISGSEAKLDRDNRQATAGLLRVTREVSPNARIVLGSTTAVYRDAGSAAKPLTESDSVLAERPYAASKFACEQEAVAYAAAGGWIAIARISNPIGSRMASALLCGTIAKQIVEIEKGKPPILFLRDLQPKRDFVAASDCVRALWQIADDGECGAVYNVASGISTPIHEIVEMYLGLTRVQHVEVRVLAVEGERSSVREQWVSNAKLRALGWKAQETLRDAARDQLDAQRNSS